MNPLNPVFQFQFCFKTYFHESNVKRHQKQRHHTELALSRPRYSCSFCEKEFGRVDHLNRHLRNVHWEQFAHLKVSVKQETLAVPNLPTRQAQVAFTEPIMTQQKAPLPESDVHFHELFDLIEEFFSNISSLELFALMNNLK